MIQCEELGHRPPIEFVGVRVDDVADGLLLVVFAYHGIVFLCMTLADHGDLSSHAALDHQIHRRVRAEVQDNARLLHHRIPRNLACGDIGRGDYLETALLHTHRTQLFKHVGDDEYMEYSPGGIIRCVFYESFNSTSNECCGVI